MCVCVLGATGPNKQNIYNSYSLRPASGGFGSFLSPLAAAGRLAQLDIHSQINDKALSAPTARKKKKKPFPCCLHG